MRAAELVCIVRVMSVDTLERVAARLGVEPDRFEVLQACIASRTKRHQLAALLFERTATPPNPTRPMIPVAPIKPRRLAFA